MNRTSALMSALNPIELPVISLESAPTPDGKTQVEKEIEIYGTMRNMDDLDAASCWEIQEQWGLYVPGTDENAGSGNVRVRMSQKSTGEPVYVLTTKVKAAKGNLECEAPSSVDMFNLFKVLASSGLRKKRYYFPIAGTDMEFEVDVFTGPTGAPVPHVKIDLEIRNPPEGFDFSNLTLPFEMADIRIISPGRKSEEDLAYVRELFKTQYDLANQCKDTVSLEEMAPSGCECGRCGWGSGVCPGVIERKEKEARIDANASRENLIAHKDKLIDLSNRCTGLAGALSYNDTRREATIKSSMHELSTAITAGLMMVDKDDGDHEFR
jgi:CYTH domain-containing protein